MIPLYSSPDCLPQLKEANEYKELKVSEVNQEWKKKRREFDQEVVIKNNKYTQLQKQTQQYKKAIRHQAQFN